MAIETQQTDLSRLKIDWKDTGREIRPNPWPRRTLWILIVLSVAVGIAAVYQFTSSPAVVEVTTVTSIAPDQPTVILNASGYVVAQRRADVASKGTGRLVELNVKEGDRVKKGDILARLESADMAAALARAQANLNSARANLAQAKAELNEAALDYERKKSLIESGMVSKTEFDTAEGRYHRAHAAVASAEAGIRAAAAAIRTAEVDFENTIIRAPFDGTVLTKNAEVGEVVAPFGSSTLAKAAVVTIADMGSLQVEADVSESNLEKIRVGQPCEIVLDAYPDTKYHGVVETIVPTADRAKATVLTKIRFLSRDERVLPEMSARVAFLSEPTPKDDRSPKIAVQPGAVVLRDNQKVAFLIQGERVQMVSLEVGEPVGNLIEVKKGLQPGDRLVLNPPEGLTAGDRVRISTK
jgi:RND family efflux transporter MFP subunit